MRIEVDWSESAYTRYIRSDDLRKRARVQWPLVGV